MIPKIIHYCWFSGDKKPALIRKCIRSWKKHLPDYEIKCWDGNSFDFDALDFTREAMSVKQYAAAADYVRLYALYNYGGIYLDSDVEVFKSLNPFLDNVFFSGIDRQRVGEYNRDYIEAGIIGSQKGFPFLRECMEYFENTRFIHPDGRYDNDLIMAPEIYAKQAYKYGFLCENKEQMLSNGIHIYPRSVFANGDYIYNHHDIDYSTLTAVHHNMSPGLVQKLDRGGFWKFCWKHNLLDTYNRIEAFRLKIFQPFNK
ncbi:MAG: hypothetical protein K5864_01230 [Bacteroidales bacterium]|nr:hypothetical protein [Bacteroidales bacterium]